MAYYWPYAIALLPWLLLLLPHCCGTTQATGNVTLPIKVLTEPRRLPAGNSLYQQSAGPPLVTPAKPAICPDHLVKGLRGQCFTLASDHYEFQLCPFHNATQRDTTYQMLTIFHGVIGVWDGWYIENGSFVAMSMRSGEPCSSGGGRVQRETIVHLACANNATSRLVSVQEHPVCRYNMLLATPLVCHPQAMLVYPCLAAAAVDTGSQRLAGYQHAWDALYTMRYNGLINESSYSILLDQLLFEAQLLADTRDTAANRATVVDRQGAAKATTVRPQLDLPETGHKNPSMDFIARQIRTLQAQIELHNNNNNNNNNNVLAGGGGNRGANSRRAQLAKP